MRIVLAVLLAAFLPALAEAQTYPAKPIRIVVPWAPGGSTDVLARLIGVKMAENWGQPAVVENKPGASGNIGSDLVAKAPADGYTLLLGSVSTHAMNPFLMPSMPFKGVDDFTTIALAAYVTNVLVTHPSVPAKSVPELIDLLKAQPGKIAYASAGNGSPNHIAAELFCRLAGVEMLHVPYANSGQALKDVQSGEVPIYFTFLGPIDGMLRSGQLKALAVVSDRRIRAWPDIPTVSELGFKDAAASPWNGVLAPAGTPPEIVNRLYWEFARIVELPDVKDRFAQMGMEPIATSPERFSAEIREAVVRWPPIVKAAGIRPE